MSKETQNNTPVSVEPVVTLNGAQLLQALDFIAPDRDTDPQQLECELTISFADGPAGSGYYCYCTDYPDEGAIMLDAEAPAAPVAAQPDVTQQTLDDVMAGIPARDAEIEALRKENEQLRQAINRPVSAEPVAHAMEATMGYRLELKPGEYCYYTPEGYALEAYKGDAPAHALYANPQPGCPSEIEVYKGWCWVRPKYNYGNIVDETFRPLFLGPQLGAPVAAQPDVTQQTLDDVMAGIPARDAEIEALRKEVEALQAALAQPDRDAVDLAREGMELHSTGAPEYIVCAELVRVAESAQLVDRSTEMQRNLVDETPNLQSQQQPVSGADGLPIELRGISEAVGNGDGFWRSCSGCHESNEGMATGPFSKTFKCHLGVGCSECGGIGAIWDTTDYDAMADFMAAEYQQRTETTEPVGQGQLRDATKMVDTKGFVAGGYVSAQLREAVGVITSPSHYLDGQEFDPSQLFGNSGELPATQTQGMTLGQRIAHVGGRENAQGYVEFGSPMAVHALIQHVLRDFHRQGPVNLAPTQQDATLQAEVLDMVRMLEANEWADHCGKSDLGQRLEWVITALQNRIAELTKSSNQQDADKVQADLLSSLVEIVDAVIASDEEGLIEHSEIIIKARAAIDAARKEPDQ